MSTITIQTKSVYGQTLYYPVNEEAKVLAQLVGKKTLSRNDLLLAGKLGHVVAEHYTESEFASFKG